MLDNVSLALGHNVHIGDTDNGENGDDRYDNDSGSGVARESKSKSLKMKHNHFLSDGAYRL
jgi:hypothetical protein